MAEYRRDQIIVALAETDASYSNYLDMDTGEVIRLNDTDTSPGSEELRNKIMEGYGGRYRYIPGGNVNPSDADVLSWIEAEGL